MDEKWLYKDLTYAVIGAAIEVHKELGSGFLEYVYEEALSYELSLRKVPFARQPELDVHYKEYLIPKKYRPDLVVDNKIIVEVKATSGLTKVNEAQLHHYLKGTSLRIGLLLNFGTRSLQTKRIIS